MGPDSSQGKAVSSVDLPLSSSHGCGTGIALCCHMRQEERLNVIIHILEVSVMRRKLVLMQLVAVVVFLALLGGCKKDGGSTYSTPTSPATPAPVAPSPNTVVIQGFAFAPNQITVMKGSSITWTNNDAVPHTATADDGSWDTGNIAAGASKSLTFANAGTFAYHCTVHPMMKSSLIVQ
jgi:plastocyanin